jgi:Tfp pilus assembly protein PilP
MTVRVLAATVVMMLLGATVAQAQIPVGTKVGEPKPADSGSYNSLGRRDPFVSLIAIRKTNTDNPVLRASQGLGSFMLHDVVVTGIARKGDVRFAILQGHDKQSYVAHVNDKLADAIIKRIDAQGVVFVDLPRPGDTNRPQETRKALRVSEVNR